MSAREQLFPQLFANTAPLARATDPVTSVQAAKQLTRSGQRDSSKLKVLAFLQSQLLEARTAHQISSASKLPHATVHKRLPDLRRDGLVANGAIVVCPITGRRSLTWYAK